MIRVSLFFVLGLAIISPCFADSPAALPGRSKWDPYYEYQSHPTARYREWDLPQYLSHYRDSSVYTTWIDRTELRRARNYAHRMNAGGSIEDWQSLQRAREAQLRDQYLDSQYDPYRVVPAPIYNPAPYYEPPVSDYQADYYQSDAYRSVP